ncbi:MAG: fused MFS/spermidine synthase [Verrucomicrobiota bacterium]|mgnify:CR=1 FL=1
MIVLLLFFCSGATALIYEVVWSKYLSLMFGSTVQAQTIVLAVFMGGLALGNRIFGRRSDLLAQPLASYGYVEFAIGLYAFFFNGLYALADHAFVRLGSRVLEQSAGLLLLKGGLSVLLLLAPTVLMGGTLPLLVAWLQKESTDAGRRSARFYSVNSLGAVCGAGLAGFFLVRELGMVSSLQMTALANVLIGITAVALARLQASTTPTPAPSAASSLASNENRAVSLSKLGWACVLVAVTGGVSMGLEVLSSRCLSLIFGGSLQAFAIVLMAFIFGIGIGSAVIASPRAARIQQESAIFFLILGAACWIGLFVATIEEWTVIYSQARSGLAANATGYFYHQSLITIISLIVLGVPAALLGAVLPLCMRLVSQASSTLGNHVGQLLTWNTLGAVAGVMLTGFVLMPKLGLRGSLGLLAVMLSVVALLLAWARRQQNGPMVAGGVAFVLLWIILGGGEGWRHVLGSGIFRLRTANLTVAMMEERKKYIKILFYEDAADATVSVETSAQEKEDNEIVLRINGKPDASTRGDLSTQYLLGHLPLLARPDSRQVFVLGFGSGITAGAVLGHPIDQLTIAENCQPVLQAAKWFEPWNRGVLTNSRTRVWVEDARTILKLSPQTYDIIISEPSNPWMAGIGSVFSREFYELAAGRLREGGVMAQWFHIYEMHDGIVNLVLRTFGTVFPFLEVWDSESGDIILLGSKKPWKSSLEVYQRVYDRALPRQDLERIGLKTPETVFARQIASQRSGFALAGDGPIQSDEFPVLEYAAPRAFYIGAQAKELFLFDERTLQSALAPAEKRAALKALPDPILRSVFKEFPSGNPELMRYLNWRSQIALSTNSGPLYLENPFLPVIFRSADSYPQQAEIPSKASEELARLLQAEALLQANPARWREGVEAIEAILQTSRPQADASPGSSPVRFAALAALTRLRHDDWRSARHALALGLAIDAQEKQLLYLQRIIDREHPEKPLDTAASQ